jgi:hypothetical protein
VSNADANQEKFTQAQQTAKVAKEKATTPATS